MLPPDSPQQSDSAQALSIGAKIFARFVLIRKIGQGGMGQVWLAMDEILEREVALKFLPDMLVHDPAAIEELRAETRRALRLTHEGIVRTYDFYCANDMACIAMEYVNGGTLSQIRLKQPARVFEPEQILPWIEQACTALHYAHTVAKVAHRDLKPSNIMIDELGRVKLTDFGVARSLSDSVSRVSNQPNSSGTLPYMSPQQLYGEKPRATDDIYAMGATIFELLTSKPPFYSGSVERQIVDRISPTMSERRIELEIESDGLIPEHWERVVAACLAKDAATRPQSMQDLAIALANPSSAQAVAPSAAVSPSTHARTKSSAISSAPVLPKHVPPLPSVQTRSDSAPATHASSPSNFPPAFQSGGTPTYSSPARISSSQAIIWLIVGIVVALGLSVIGGGVWLVRKLQGKPTTFTQVDGNGIRAPASDTGRALIETTPSGAMVSLDGQSPQPSPATFEGLTPGEYGLDIQHAGYEPVSRRIVVDAGQTTKIGAIPLVKLAPEPREVEPPPARSIMPVASTTCQGVFTYNDPERPHPTAFTLTFTEVAPVDPSTGSGKIAGTMSEPRVDFGPASAKSLASTFAGTWTPTPEGARIAFSKIYLHVDGHPSEHLGTYDASTRTVTGTWEINGYSGAFTLTGLSTTE